jgi:hypothetical protein
MNNPLADYAADRYKDSIVPNQPGHSQALKYQPNRATMDHQFSQSQANPLLANTNFGNQPNHGGNPSAHQPQAQPQQGGYGQAYGTQSYGGQRTGNTASSQNRAPVNYSTIGQQQGARMGQSQQGSGAGWANNRDAAPRGVNPLTPLSFTYN